MTTVRTQRIQYTPSAFARESLLHISETGSLTALKPHTSQRTNLGGYLLIVVEKGSGTVQTDTKRFELATGDIAFIDCSKFYSHSTDNNLWTIRWAHFDGPALLGIYHKFMSRSGKPVFTPPAATPYLDLLHQLYTTSNSSSYVRDMSINTILSSLLENIMRDCWSEEKIEPKGKENIETVRLYLDSHYMEPISLPAMAKQFFMEKTYLVRLFSKMYGISPMKYLQTVRIQKTKELLRFTDDKLAVISEKVGVSSEQYLSKIFKDAEGINPSEYRKRWK